MRPLFGPLLVVGLLGASPQAPVSPPAANTALIVGRAVDGTTGRPLGEVTVTLGPPASAVAADPSLLANSTRVLTSGEGYFVFAQLPAGDYDITATRPGYVNGAYGKRAPSSGASQSIQLTDGERRGDVTVALWKYAALEGRVVDETGDALVGISVRVMRRAIVAGRPLLSSFGNSSATTDDRGIYRIGMLTPGDYVVGIVSTPATVPASLQDTYMEAVRTGNTTLASTLAGESIAGAGMRVGNLAVGPGITGSYGVQGLVFRGDALFVYPTVFYPAAMGPSEAVTITLASGEERTNVDFAVRAVPSVRVSGAVSGPDGPVTSAPLELVSLGAASMQQRIAAATTVSDGTGAFTFLGVTPGQYTVSIVKPPPRPANTAQFDSIVQVGNSTIFTSSSLAQPPIAAGPTLWAAEPVVVTDRDVSGVAVTLRSGFRVSGHVEFDGALPPPTADKLRQTAVTFDQADGQSGSAIWISQIGRGQVDATGAVHAYELPPGRYVVRASGPGLGGWTFAGAESGGANVTDAPLDLAGHDVTDLEIKFTDHPAALSGAVREAQASSVSATVLLFPAERASWQDYGSTSRRLRTAAAGKGGAFRIANVPPGDYLAVAIPNDPGGGWTDPATLEKLARLATRVVIADGDSKSVDLSVRTVPQ